MKNQFITSKEFVEGLVKDYGLSGYDNELNYQYALEKIGEFISDYRHINGLTQKELSEEMGVSQAMVAKYESGDCNFSLKTLMKILFGIGYKITFSFSKIAKVQNSDEFVDVDTSTEVEVSASSPLSLVGDTENSNRCYPWPEKPGEAVA